MMKRFLVCSITLGVLSISATASKAATVNREIDYFTSPNVEDGILVTQNDPIGSLLQTGLTGGVLGGSRNLSLTYEVGTGTIDSEVILSVTPGFPNGLLNISNGSETPGANSTSLVTWNANTSYGDLTDGRFVINVDNAGLVPVNLTIIANRGASSIEETVSASTGLVNIPFSSFSDPNFFNSPLDTISLRVTGDALHAISINRVFVEGETPVNPAVPEPYLGMGLLGIACLGMITPRRKK